MHPLKGPTSQLDLNHSLPRLHQVYFALGRSLHATLPDLGSLTLCRAAVQALASPLCGALGHLDRTRVVATGCILWGLMTSAIGFSTSLHQAMVACAFNGLGLALVIPALSSLVADSNEAHARGKAFGTMQLTSSLGGMAGALFATNVSGFMPLGIPGWRFAFHCVAGLSLATAFLVLRCTNDPRDSTTKSSTPWTSSGTQSSGNALSGSASGRKSSAVEDGFGGLLAPLDGSPPGRAGAHGIAHAVRAVLRIPSFQVIVLQGIVGET